MFTGCQILQKIPYGETLKLSNEIIKQEILGVISEQKKYVF